MKLAYSRMAQPVFYDPQRARWKRLRTLLDAAGILLSAVIVVFIYTAISEPLPKLFLPFEKRPYHALKETERYKERERRRQTALRHNHRHTNVAPSQVELNTDEGISAAFYVPWDAASFSSLREYAHQIDLLYPEWLHMLTPDGHLEGVDEQTGTHFDVLEGGAVHPVDDQVMKFLKSSPDVSMEVIPLVNNSDFGNRWVDISAFLGDPNAHARFRREIAAFLSNDKYRGLMVDFEELRPKALPGFVSLLNELEQDLHAKGQKLYVSVPAGDPAFPYRAVANASDGVVLMNYDEHHGGEGGTAGAVASQDWFTEKLRAAKKAIPLDKLICAIANYGYDWVHLPRQAKTPPRQNGVTVSVQDSWLTARDSEAEVDFDGDSLNPHISYLDERNLRHDIWFLDGVTALNQMRAARRLGVRTFALWRLGSEDRSLWKIWDFPLDGAAPSALNDVPPGRDVDMEGRGEILNIEATPSNGSRTLTLDSSGLITDETMDSLPEPYRIGRYGASPNQVAISFDDGPDPQWTPKILDILKREHATATFFLIGSQAHQ